MKITIDTQLNIGDFIYRIEFYNGEPDTDIENIGKVEIYGFSIDKNGVWIENNEFGECCAKLEDIDRGKPGNYGFSYFSSKENAIRFINEIKNDMAVQ